MAITYYMLQMPPFLLFVLIVFFSALFTTVCTYVFRKYVRLNILRSHNEVTGFLYLSIASFYALLLSFVMLLVWEQYNEAHSNMSKEGSSAMNLYQDIKHYPDTVESKKLMTVYLNFVYNVVDEEFPSMEMMKQSRKTPESFNKVFYVMEHLNPKTPFQIQLVSQMFSHLSELSMYRGLRTSSIDAEIPSPIWLPIIFGALITFLCSLLLDIEHSKMHILLNAMLGVFVGAFIFIIILLDHPFTGELGVEPKLYKQIFTLEQWATESPVSNTIIIK
ncbi:MAG: hypothetical protein V4667_01535 [Bacteroidota bacterium]